MHKGPSSQADSLRGVTGINLRDAALIGASNAFRNKSAAPPPVPRKSDGALLAATLAGTKPLAEQRSLLTTSGNSADVGRAVKQTTGDSTISDTASLPSQAVAPKPGWSKDIAPPNRDRPVLSISATASRSTGLPQGKRPAAEKAQPTANIQAGKGVARTTFELPILTLHEATPLPGQRPTGMGSRQGGTDDTPIAPTTSLVKLFEQGGQGTHAHNTVHTAKPKSPPTPRKDATAGRPKQEPKVSPRLDASRYRQEYDEAVALEEAARELRGRPPIQGRPSAKRSSSAAAAASAAALPPVLKAKPDLPPPRRSANKPIPPPADEPAKVQNVHAVTPPRSQPTHLRKTSSNLSLPETFNRSSLSPNPSHYNQRSMRQISPHMTGDSLANAIVGASLASRQASPHRTGTPTAVLPPPARSTRHQYHSHNPLQHFRTRSNSPQKSSEASNSQRVALRTTLRKDESSSSDEGRGKQGRGRKHRFRKHPNKHHEGDRKRWRDTITERERRRYEGLWAANKGLCIPSSTPELALASSSSPNTVPTEDVLDLVVRDIWSRSRLPPQVLADIWELVDHRGNHRLTREEFVVGTWLIDQCLKGRKVPSRVMDSVWTSVRLLGVKVRKKNFQ